MGGGKRENNTGTHRARMSRARTGCPLGVTVTTVASTTPGKGRSWPLSGRVSSGGVIRRRREERKGLSSCSRGCRSQLGQWGPGRKPCRAERGQAQPELHGRCLRGAYLSHPHGTRPGLGSPVWGGHMASMGALVGKSRERHKCRFALLLKEIEPQRGRCGTHLRYLSSHPAQP